MLRRVSIARSSIFLAAAVLLGACVCVKHAVERPEKHAIDCGAERKLTAGDHQCKLTLNGVQRTFRIHIPAAPPRQPLWPVMLAFHGVGSNAEQMAHISKLSDLADRERFLVVYPQGLGLVPSWNTAIVGTAKRSDADDVGFVRTLLGELGDITRYDPQRVYAVGFSNGGFFAHKLACEMSDTIAAIGVVAAINAEQTCSPIRPVPVIAFHGLRDPVVLFGGAEEIGVPSVKSTIKAWAERDGCASEPALLEEAGDVRCEDWPECRDGAQVVLCTAKEGGHTWPGGRVPAYVGKTANDIDASERIWTFLQRHQLRGDG